MTDDVPANQAHEVLGNRAHQEFGEEQLNTVLKRLDKCVGSIIEALPVSGLLVLYTCQGDTAEYRRMQASSLKFETPGCRTCSVCISYVTLKAPCLHTHLAEVHSTLWAAAHLTLSESAFNDNLFMYLKLQCSLCA